MAETLKDLRELPLDELIQRHDAAAPSTMVGVSYYLAEIARRDAAKQTETMLRLTWVIAIFSAAIFLLTVLNTYVVFIVN